MIPNQFTPIAIPIEVLGEVSGTVRLLYGDQSKPLERVLIEMVNSKNEVVVKTLSDEMGFYNYLGLPPGTYTVRVNAAQIEKLGYQIKNSWPTVTITATLHGDSKTGVDIDLIVK